jgi:nucleotide-binding universal stress UspA family protein
VANTLFETASELGVDLMVVGAHGTTGIAKFLLGGVAEALLREAQIDVLVVPSQSTTRNTTTEARP